MDNDIVNIKDPIQLQQMVIFFRDELEKYKNEVNMLRHSDYYSLVLRYERQNVQLIKQKKKLKMEFLKQKRDHERKVKTYYDHIQATEIQKKKQLSSIEGLLKKIEELRAENRLIKGKLEQENAQLIKQKKELKMELLKQKRDHAKKIKIYYNHIQATEIQKKKQLSSIEGLLKELEELRTENKLIKENLKSTKNELLSMNSDTKYKSTIDGIENKLNAFTREISIQINNIIEAIERTSLEQANSDNINKHLSKGKRNDIEKLEEALVDVKKHHFFLSEKTMMDSEVLTNLDSQVNKVMVQSMDFEKQLNHKLRLLDDLDHKLHQLTIEINNDKTV